MKIRFLGTGAADWNVNEPSPDVFSFRRFSSAVIDDTLLIDPGPCVPEYGRTFGYDLSGIKYVVNTHRHADHFSEATLAVLTAGGAEFFPLEAGESATLGKYTVTAYKANHGTCPGAVHLMITDGEKRLYYALDGAWLLYEEYKAIMKKGVDVCVLDATIGEKEGDFRIFEHNDLRMVREMIMTLKPYVGRFVISHMARTLHTDHKTLEKEMSNIGVITAFDTLEVEI